jgi:hypothetical protein
LNLVRVRVKSLCPLDRCAGLKEKDACNEKHARRVNDKMAGLMHRIGLDYEIDVDRDYFFNGLILRIKGSIVVPE